MDEVDIRILAARVPTSSQGRYDDGIPEKPAPLIRRDVAGRILEGSSRRKYGVDSAYVPGPYYESLLALRLAPGERQGPEVTVETDDNGSTEAQETDAAPVEK